MQYTFFSGINDRVCKRLLFNLLERMFQIRDQKIDYHSRSKNNIYLCKEVSVKRKRLFSYIFIMDVKLSNYTNL
jgi:hypothetical protein